MSTETKTRLGYVVWHELSTTDVAKAIAFYTELLGWQVEVWKPGELDYSMISVDGATHGGFQPAQEGAPSHWLGHIQVAAVDAAVATAAALGAKVLAGPMDMPEVGRFALVADPQGAVCSLFTPAQEGPQPEGVFAWDELMADDVEAAKAFYTEVVGWTTTEMDAGTGPYTMFTTSDGTPVAGCMAKPEMAPRAAWVTYLRTDDADATAARAATVGGTVLQEPFDIPNVGRIAIIADSTGAAVGLFQPSEG